MKSWVQLRMTHARALPAEFGDDDTRFPEELAEMFIREYTMEGDIVFDPFAGFGTTLVAAERMGRVGYGVELERRRYEYARARLRQPENLVYGDARRLAAYEVSPIDLCLTSPPYMNRLDPEDPLTAYALPGRGYAAYLQDIRAIYEQVGRLMRPEAAAVIEVANLKGAGGVTTLAWDIAGEVAKVLRFEGEVVVGWDRYGYGYEHSYCLVFRRNGKGDGDDR